jgi:hypothetical protein
MYIGIDFDGTCVTHEFPRIGKDIGAVPVLKKLVAGGDKLILFTMRSDRRELKNEHFEVIRPAENYLSEAVEWFKTNGIELYGIQINPTQKEWTDSPKAYCNIYIDDASLGCPLKYNEELSSRPFVDWKEVEALLF